MKKCGLLVRKMRVIAAQLVVFMPGTYKFNNHDFVVIFEQFILFFKNLNYSFKFATNFVFSICLTFINSKKAKILEQKFMRVRAIA